MERSMKNVHTNRRRLARLFALSLIVTGIAACDRLPADPGTARTLRAPEVSRHDDTPGDSLGCKDGWVMTGGRAVCE
jgi:hypothetical protein